MKLKICSHCFRASKKAGSSVLDELQLDYSGDWLSPTKSLYNQVVIKPWVKMYKWCAENNSFVYLSQLTKAGLDP